MSEAKERVADDTTSTEGRPNLLQQYRCGPIRFSGHQDALYERHLLFNDVIDPVDAGPRERFEAVARSGRDVLSQRWVQTEQRKPARRISFCSASAHNRSPIAAAGTVRTGITPTTPELEPHWT